jgi:hypothetical protein
MLISQFKQDEEVLPWFEKQLPFSILGAAAWMLI